MSLKNRTKSANKLEMVQNSRRVETFVSLGKPSAFTLTQRGLELKAVTHPNDLFVGEKKPVSISHGW